MCSAMEERLLEVLWVGDYINQPRASAFSFLGRHPGEISKIIDGSWGEKDLLDVDPYGHTEILQRKVIGIRAKRIFYLLSQNL